MKEGSIVLFIIILNVNIVVIKATTNLHITGPGTNLSGLFNKIFLKGSGEWIPNLIPDMTFNDKTRDRKPGVDAQVGRRSLKQFLADKRKYLFEAADSFLQPLYQPKKEGIAQTVLNAIGLKTFPQKPTRREVVHVHHHHVKIDEEKFLVNRQHERKIKELKYYMEHNFKVVDHFYHELKRIQKTSVVIDDLRKMVDWIGKHIGGGPGIKQAFKCFHDRRFKDPAKLDMWKNRVPNNVYIDPFKDPYEYGFDG